jgi:hypothetical protein
LAASCLFNYFRQFAAEQYLASLAYGVPALEQVPAGHGTPLSVHTPPEQLPLPVIRPSDAAEASGIDKLKIANAIVANAAIIHFIDQPP